jgi:hypothetical protein
VTKQDYMPVVTSLYVIGLASIAHWGLGLDMFQAIVLLALGLILTFVTEIKYKDE